MVGECHRHPPAANEIDMAFWAVTLDVDFCGEHPEFQTYIAFLRRDNPLSRADNERIMKAQYGENWDKDPRKVVNPSREKRG